MNKLALKLPGGEDIDNPVPQIPDLGALVSGLLNISIFIAAFLSFYYLIWGAWAYIFASGEKENLAKAREKIKWALIGLLVTVMAYTIATYAGQIFPAKGGLPF
ncbi:MAG: hypothetical protein AAB414_00745 [Patescibacteria group bacterium]